jgi:hypothetical protein
MKRRVAFVLSLSLILILSCCRKQEPEDSIWNVLTSEAELLDGITISQLAKDSTCILQLEVNAVSTTNTVMLSNGATYSRLLIEAEITAAIRGGQTGELMTLEAPIAYTQPDGTRQETAFRRVWYSGQPICSEDRLSVFGLVGNGYPLRYITITDENACFLLLPETIA